MKLNEYMGYRPYTREFGVIADVGRLFLNEQLSEMACRMTQYRETAGETLAEIVDTLPRTILASFEPTPSMATSYMSVLLTFSPFLARRTGAFPSAFHGRMQTDCKVKLTSRIGRRSLCVSQESFPSRSLAWRLSPVVSYRFCQGRPQNCMPNLAFRCPHSIGNR